jgi:hypothetical protein
VDYYYAYETKLQQMRVSKDITLKSYAHYILENNIKMFLRKYVWSVMTGRK